MELNEIWNVAYLENLSHPEVYVEIDGEMYNIFEVEVTDDGHLLIRTDYD